MRSVHTLIIGGLAAAIMASSACWTAPVDPADEEGVARSVAQADSVTDCTATCTQAPKPDGTPSDARLDCCERCLTGLPYGQPYVCSHQTRLYLKCAGIADPDPLVPLVCNSASPTKCPAGSHKISTPGSPGADPHGWGPAAFCTRTDGGGQRGGHVQVFAYMECADGTKYHPPPYGRCPDKSDGKPKCLSSGDKKSRIINCSFRNPAQWICCAPDFTSPDGGTDAGGDGGDGGRSDGGRADSGRASAATETELGVKVDVSTTTETAFALAADTTSAAVSTAIVAEEGATCGCGDDEAVDDGTVVVQ